MTISTTTTTIRQPEPPLESIALSARERSFQAQLESLMKQMAASEAFSPEEKHRIEAWFQQFHSRYLLFIKSTQGQEQAAIALALFIIKLLHPIILNPNNSSHTSAIFQRLYLPALFQFRNQIKHLISSLLTENDNVDGFIKDCQASVEEKDLLEIELQKILKTFQEQTQALYDAACQTDQNLLETFNALKNKLQAFNARRETTNAKTQIQLDALTTKVNQITNQLISSTMQTQTLSNQIKASASSVHELHMIYQDSFKDI